MVSMDKLSPKRINSDVFNEKNYDENVEAEESETPGEVVELKLADAQGNVPPGAQKRWVSKKFAVKNNLLAAEKKKEKSWLQKARDYFTKHGGDEMVLVYANGAVQVANASDLFGQFAANTGKIGRIVGAIAAQNGVMDKSIPAEGFVAEMLNMGSLRKEQLETLQSDKFTGVLDAVKAAQAGMQSNPTVESRETKTIDYAMIIEKKDSVDGVTEVKLDDDFYSKVDDLSKNQEIAKLADGTKLYEDIVKYLTDIEQTDENPVGPARSQLSTNVQYLDEKLADFKIHQQSLSTIEQSLGDLRWMKDGNASLEKLRQFMELVDVRSLMATTAKPNSEEKDLIQKNFGVISNLSVTLNGSSDTWHSFSEVLTNRLAPLTMGRQWTSGLSHGLSDISLVVSDLRDPTIMRLIPDGATGFIERGLKPVLNGNKMFEPIDEKLKTISTRETKEAVAKMKKILNLTAAGEATPDEVLELFVNVATCGTENGDTVRKTDHEDVGKLLTSIERLEKSVSDLGARIKNFIATRSVQDSSLDEMVEIVKQLPSNAYQNVINEKAVEIRKILMADDKLGKFREKIQKDQALFANAIGKDFKNEAEEVVKNKNIISEFLAKSSFLGELALYDCLYVQKDLFRKVVPMIEASQLLRGLKPQEADVVSSAVQAVSGVAKEVVDKAGGVVKSMKDASNEKTAELKKMPDARKKAKTIGDVSGVLENVSKLRKESKHLLQQKQELSVLVEKAIANNTNRAERETLSKMDSSWKKAENTMETELKKVDEFETKLKDAKLQLLVDYGTTMAKFAIDDVLIDYADMQAGISTITKSVTDPKTVEDLKTREKALIQISELDLRFAKHTPEFAAAPDALKAVSAFFAQFSKSIARNQQADDGSNSTLDRQWEELLKNSTFQKQNASLVSEPLVVRADSNLGLLIGVPAGVATLSGVLIAIYCCCLRKGNANQQSFNEAGHPTVRLSQRSPITIMRMIYDLFATVQDDEELEKFNLRVSLVFNMDPDPKDMVLDTNFKREHLRLRNGHEGVPLKGQVIVETANGEKIKVNANYFHHVQLGMAPDIATQAPLPETMEHFYYMVMNEKSEYIVMLCNLEEREVYSDGRSSTVRKADQYWPSRVNETMRKGDITVTLLEETTLDGGEIVKRKLKFLNHVNQKEHSATQYHYTGWPAQGTPRDTKCMHKLWGLTAKNKKPLIVHCSTGGGRTMVFIGQRFMFHGLRLQFGTDTGALQTCLAMICCARNKAINISELSFLIWCTYMLLVSKDLCGFRNPKTPMILEFDTPITTEWDMCDIAHAQHVYVIHRSNEVSIEEAGRLGRKAVTDARQAAKEAVANARRAAGNKAPAAQRREGVVNEGADQGAEDAERPPAGEEELQSHEDDEEDEEHSVARWASDDEDTE